MGWKGGLQGGAVVFCAAWGKYWGSLKMMILFWGGFVFRLSCGLGEGFARGYAAGAAWYDKKACVGGCGF